MKKLLLIALLIVGCGTEPEDCAGVAGGTAGLDSCAVCIGGTTNLTTCVQDCADVWGGTAAMDDCGVCDGIDGYVADTCYDCANVPNGDAIEDDCGVCDNVNTNDCQFYYFFIASISDDKAIHGMQFEITGVTLLGIEPVSGFEIKYDEISENLYKGLIFSMQGQVLPEHLTFIFSGLIENLCIKNIILADSQGNGIEIINDCD